MSIDKNRPAKSAGHFRKQKKEERNIEKEIQNQPPYSGGV